MYLSRIALNPGRRETVAALASPQVLHAAVERSTGSDKQRNLWRIDWLGDSCYILIVSAVRPDCSIIAAQFGYPDMDGASQTKAYDALLARLDVGQEWRFRLRANPVHSISHEQAADSKRGKVVAHVTVLQQQEWLIKRAHTYGFTLAEDTYDVVHNEWLNFRKGKDGHREVTLRTATFEGVLTIADPHLFRQTLLKGIGRAKAYGCGLLTVTRSGGVGGA